LTRSFKICGSYFCLNFRFEKPIPYLYYVKKFHAFQEHRMSSRCLIASLLVLFAVGWSDVSAVDMPNMQVRIYIDTKAQYLQLRSLHLDQVWEEKNYIEILTDSTELAQLQALGYRTEVVIADFEAFGRARLAAKDMGGYKTLSEINDYIDLLIIFYPELVSEKVSIGQTIEGRPTWAVKISDNPNVDEDEIEICALRIKMGRVRHANRVGPAFHICRNPAISPVDRIPAHRGFEGVDHDRSEERRVGKECRSRWSPYH